MAMTPKGWSISALAVEFGRDRRTVAAAVAGLTPIGREGRADLYRLTDVLPALVGGGRPTDLDDAKARKLAAEAELAELELAKARGEVVAIGDAAKLIAEEYTAVRSKLLALPTKLAPLLNTDNTEATRALLARGIHEALDELVGAVSGGDEGGAAEGAGGESEGPTRSNGEPMGGLLSQAFT